MKLYTFYTDSHISLLNNYFLSSIPKDDNFEVIIEKFPQECSSGNFMESGWMQTMHKKISYVLRGIEENPNKVFIHSDCDVYFFKQFKDDLLNQMEDCDMIGIDDGGNTISCGFFACRGNEKTKKLFETVLNNMSKFGNDQHAMNHFRHDYIKSKILDLKYFNIHHIIGQQVWNPNIDIPHLNKNILMMHANWTVGVDNKSKLIDKVKEKLNDSI